LNSGPLVPQAIRCSGVRSGEHERGWTARLTVNDEIAVYCPECDEREFGDADEKT
jgi:hypothetical protein